MSLIAKKNKWILFLQATGTSKWCSARSVCSGFTKRACLAFQSRFSTGIYSMPSNVLAATREKRLLNASRSAGPKPFTLFFTTLTSCGLHASTGIRPFLFDLYAQDSFLILGIFQGPFFKRNKFLLQERNLILQNKGYHT